MVSRLADMCRMQRPTPWHRCIRLATIVLLEVSSAQLYPAPCVYLPVLRVLPLVPLKFPPLGRIALESNQVPVCIIAH